MESKQREEIEIVDEDSEENDDEIETFYIDGKSIIRATGWGICLELVIAILVNLLISWAWPETSVASFSARHVIAIWVIMMGKSLLDAVQNI